MPINFLSLYPELHILIFEALDDFTDLTALGSTCRSLNSVFRSNTGVILRRIGERSILSFDDALRTARANVLATEDKCRFDLEQGNYIYIPTKAFCESLSDAQPTPDEIKMALNLAAIVNRWYAVLVDPSSYGMRKPDPEATFASQLGTGSAVDVEERYHRGAYRMLLLGCLFSNVYPEPFTGLSENYPHDLARRDALDTVQRYPIYHSSNLGWKYKQLLSLFGGFIEWIARDGEKRWIAEGIRKSQPTTGRDGSFREILLLLTVMKLTNLIWREATDAERECVKGQSSPPHPRSALV